jgi:alkylation response protein AidB-like acyl-CoA dehydrogenase
MISRQYPPARVRSAFESASGFDEDVWGSLAGLGVFGIAVPEEYDGAGQHLLDLAVAAEALGEAATPGPFIEHAVAILALMWTGSPDQCRSWLPELVAGSRRASVTTLDSDPFWDPTRWSTEAGKPLVGMCSSVLAAETADLLLVGIAGGFALVDTRDPAVEITRVDVLDRGRRIARVRLDNPCYEPVVADSDGAACARDAALVLLAADAAGGSAHCLAAAVAYAKTREQFGVTIGHFQGVKHQIAGMAIDVEPSRMLYWYAAHALDSRAADAVRAAALAKAQLTDVYVSTARKAIEVHGGIGYTWECDLHFWLKRAVLDRMLFGTPQVHRRRVADLSGW